MKLIIINGPNLNMQGSRQTDIYGTGSFDELLPRLRQRYAGHLIDYYQSNVEGELINKLQQACSSYDGVVLNAGGYTHTSVAIRDAVAAIAVPVVEVHISNIHAREEFRRHSLLSEVCRGTISGFGLDGYRLAIEALCELKGLKG